MHRHHHGYDSRFDPRFSNPEGRRFDRDDDRDRYYERTSASGNERSGYRSNDNAPFGGGYQAGGSSGEGAAYGGRDWYAGGAGDNRPYADIYERGERGYSPYYERDRDYDPRNFGARNEPDYEARRFGPAPRYHDDRRFNGDYDGRARGGYESSHEQRRDDHGRFAGRDPGYSRGGSQHDDRSRSDDNRYMPRRDDGRFRR